MARTPTPTVRRPARPPQRQPEKNLLNYPRAGARGPLRWWPSLRLVVFLVALGIIGAVAALAVAYRLTSIPEPNAESSFTTSTAYYADGTTKLADFSEINRTPVPPEQISPSVKEAIIAAEDKTFYENRGISLTGIGRAAVGVATGEDRGGGSTITQQYVKNVYLTNEVTYTRKAKEALIALKIDQTSTKDAILTDYLNTIYFGRGAYGIQAAAQVYYAKNAIDLTDAEAALLVGIVPAPSAWDPLNDPEQAQSRYAYVVNSMVDTGALTRDEALSIPQMPGTQPLTTSEDYRGPQGYLLQSVRDDLVAHGISEEDIDTKGYKIVTTFDVARQQAAVTAMEDQDVFPTDRMDPTVRGGLVSIDPATGGVVAMYGGRNYLTTQNAITQAEAQPGSTFKVFTLIAALEQGHSLSETFDGNSPAYFPGYTKPNGDRQPVTNYGDADLGRVNLLKATASSVNTAYVALNVEVGAEATRQVAIEAGVPEDKVKANLSNVLGTDTLQPIDMAAAYTTIAAGGTRRTPHFVASVTLADGSPVYTADTTGTQAFDADVMANATYALQGVVQNGSGSWAERLGRPAAGKTGTTQGNRAAWFSGFTPQLETTVVMFNPSDGSDGTEVNSQLELPTVGRTPFTGGSWPVRVWTEYMTAALDGTEELDFPKPTSQARGGSSSTSTATSAPSASRSETSTAAPSATSEETAEPEETTAEPTPTATENPSEEAPSTTEPTTEADPSAAAGATVQPGPGGGGGNGGDPAGANGNGNGNGSGNGNGNGAGNGNGG